MNFKIKKIIIKISFIFIAGCLDFFASYFLVQKMQIPLFLDTTFTLGVLFIFGPVESISAYLIKTILEIIRIHSIYKAFDFEYLYFLSILIVIIITWLFIRKKERLSLSVNKSFLYLLLTAATAAAVCSIISGIISYFTYNKTLEEWAYDKIIFSFGFSNSNLLATCIIGRYPITVLDRVITTFAGFGIYYGHKKIKEKTNY